jgi:hypothetical protein
MKKIVILSSLLALTACGGGSGGGVAPANTSFERAAESNSVITGMVSRIKDGDSYEKLSTQRSASNNVDKVLYLDNVLFKSADKEYDKIHSDEDFVMRFHVDKHGKIDAIEVIDDGEAGLVERVNDHTNEFVFDDEEEGSKVSAFVNLFGSKKGLKYSDFGFVEIRGVEHDSSDGHIIKTQFIMPIAGGYEAKNITDKMNKDNFSKDLVFKGTAIADVGEPNTMVEGDRLTLRDDNATLTFKQTSGDEVFAAHFKGQTIDKVKYDNWYDVTATKYTDGDASIAFSNEDGRIIADKFKVTDSGKVKNNEHANQLSVEFNYYGDKAQAPHEATGIIHYQCEGCQPFLMGFGGKMEK